MIRFQCPACDETIKAVEMLAGKTVRCPKCRATVQVPAVSTPTGPAPVSSLGSDEKTSGPKLSDFAPPTIVRPTTTDDEDEFQLKPLAPPPLRKPTTLPAGLLPANDTRKFSLDELEIESLTDPKMGPPPFPSPKPPLSSQPPAPPVEHSPVPAFQPTVPLAPLAAELMADEDDEYQLKPLPPPVPKLPPPRKPPPIPPDAR